MAMEFIEGSSGIYNPISVLFGTPMYEWALQLCWHLPPYKARIALVAEFMRIQQNEQLPCELTAEDMVILLMEESRKSLRVMVWEFELEDFDEEVAKPLLKLVWDVNNSMWMRDVIFEARRVLSSPETAPPQFNHPKFVNKAHEYTRLLAEQQQGAPSSKLTGPLEVVIDVVPKVLQGFWLPPPDTCFSMPSKQLSQMAVGATKAVQDRVTSDLFTTLFKVPFSRSIRDKMIQSIHEKVELSYDQDVLVEKINGFAADLLNMISDVAAKEICALFQL